MKNRGSLLACRAAVAMVAILATGAVTTSAFAQGGGGGGRQGGRGQGRGGQQLTVVSIPASALAIGLKLTDDQKVKIETAQKPIRQMMEDMMKARQAGTPPDQDAMEKMRTAQTEARTTIEGILTPDQKTMLPDFVKKLGALQRFGIQPGVYADLKLTPDQETKLADIAAKSQAKMQAARDSGEQVDMRAMMTETRTAGDAVLTDDQKKAITDYNTAHPMMQGGGGRRGGGGAPGGGGGNL